jgi:propanol-preferring alcohol dehydrogenase
MLALQMTGWQQDPEMREVETPAPAPGEVVIRVGAAGVCHSDLHVLYEFPAGAMPWTPPFTLGHENAGWVAELGAGVRGLEVGQPVVVYGPWGCGTCAACAAGRENYCRTAHTGDPVAGLGRDGGMAGHLLVPAARHLVPLPDGLTPRQAAPLTDAGLTPLHAVERVREQLVPGSTAVVVGVGGLGHLALQVLRATTAARVVAVDPRGEARALAEANGADVVLDPGSDDVAAAIRDLTRGHGADAVLDMVGSDDTLGLAGSAVGVDGSVVIVGLGGGSLPVSLLGLPLGIRVSTSYWGTRSELLQVLALAARGDLTPHVTSWPLIKALDAYAALRAGAITGRAVVVPNED